MQPPEKLLEPIQLPRRVQFAQQRLIKKYLKGEYPMGTPQWNKYVVGIGTGVDHFDNELYLRIYLARDLPDELRKEIPRTYYKINVRTEIVGKPKLLSVI